MKDFSYWKRLHENEKLEEFSSDPLGLLWLKLKSIVRKEFIEEFINENKLKIDEKSLSGRFLELYKILSKEIKRSHSVLDGFIKNKNKETLSSLDTKRLVSELYKLKNFDWGGDYQNSLDKYLVSRYVKTYQSY